MSTPALVTPNPTTRHAPPMRSVDACMDKERSARADVGVRDVRQDLSERFE